jgi:hypothetical protein
LPRDPARLGERRVYLLIEAVEWILLPWVRSVTA